MPCDGGKNNGNADVAGQRPVRRSLGTKKERLIGKIRRKGKSLLASKNGVGKSRKLVSKVSNPFA